MATKLSPWCKKAKIAMIEQELSVKDLAKELNLTREYVSAIINGRSYSPAAVKAISDFLNIAETACSEKI